MDYSVRPSRSELERVRSIIEDGINSYEYALDLEEAEIFLSWQRHEGDISVLEASKNELMIAVNPDADEYNVDGVLRALFELEFVEKADYPEIDFKWQEVAKFAYTALRMEEIKGEEIRLSEDIVARWPSIQEQLPDRVSEYNEFFYLNTGLIGEALADKLGENYDSGEIPELKKSDIMAAGEKFFE